MKERALLVSVKLPNEEDAWEIADSAHELNELATSAGLEVAGEIRALVRQPNPKYVIGSGKVQEIAESAKKAKANVVIFGTDLSSSQQRSLEEAIGMKTIDRTQLILDIFARRARSLEGKLQVELAQLNYLLPRLQGQGVMLSRLGGGVGTRGPGEQKLEMDRRRIRERIGRLKAELQKVTRHRGLHRSSRAERGAPVVALVGYTNAGKSTLFNALTDAGVVSENRMFSTLDPTVRRGRDGGARAAMFVDTVGFLHLLPHHLIQAFKATLEEVLRADLLLHVIDAAHPKTAMLEKSVQTVLDELGAGKKETLLVLNKCDLLDDDTKAARRLHRPDGIFVSAKTGEGIEALLAKVSARISPERSVVRIKLPASSKLIPTLYEKGEVLSRKDEADGVRFEALLPEAVHRYIKDKLAGSR